MTTQRRDISEELVLKLLGYALCGSDDMAPTLVSAPNWDELIAIAAKQGVAQIVWQGMMELANEGKIAPGFLPGKSIKLRWAYHNEALVRRYEAQKRVIVKLAKILGCEGIGLMIIKGYGLSLCYPHPEQRACGDIDIWMLGDQRRGDEILCESLNIEINSSKHKHTPFHVDGVLVENHYDFLNIHSHRSNRAIEKILKGLAINTQIIRIDGEAIAIPEANFHALFLLRHAAAHFAAAEIALRHIVDWAMFVKHYHQKVDWTWLRKTARRYNIELFLDVINSLSSQLCGIDIELMPNTLQHKELEARVLGDILNPEFNSSKPERGLLRIVAYKFGRWWANRWKHRMVYNDSLTTTLFTQLWSHLLKPKSFKA